MYNSNSMLTQFHNKKVTLTEEQKQLMRDRRNTNEETITRYIAEKKLPKIIKFVKQGSYSMYTMVQSEVDASDIDNGIIFSKIELDNHKKREMTALEARQMIFAAFDTKSNIFKKAPECKKNCVRIFYADGFTMDVPVYRKIEGGTSEYDLASSDWKLSNPEGVTNWFNDAVIAYSPDETNGRQMRRVVRLLKFWCKSRASWNMPSGFILSKLVEEVYINTIGTFSGKIKYLNRDDLAFVDTLQQIKNRLYLDKVVKHPVIKGDTITKTTSDSTLKELESKLIEWLPVVNNMNSMNDSIIGWNKFFATDFFNEFNDDGKNLKLSIPDSPVIKSGNDRGYA